MKIYTELPTIYETVKTTVTAPTVNLFLLISMVPAPTVSLTKQYRSL